MTVEVSGIGLIKQNREDLGGLAPYFKGSEAVFQINMLKIVELDILSNRRHLLL